LIAVEIVCEQGVRTLGLIQNQFNIIDTERVRIVVQLSEVRTSLSTYIVISGLNIQLTVALS
jgi:hypothetical protein